MVLLEFSRYTDDTVGLENLLRMIQGFMQLIIANPTSNITLSQWQSWAPIALKQCAVSRRAFRYFRFIDFTAASANKIRNVTNGSEDFVLGSLEAGRTACMAVYLFLEAFTILHAIGILTSSWGAQVFSQAMKFWFYAISCAILGLSYQLLTLRDDEKLNSILRTEKPEISSYKEVDDDERRNKVAAVKGEARKSEIPRRVLFWQLVGACCNLLIPGTHVGWLNFSPAVVAVCSIFSSWLSSIEIWKRVNR